jgi:hypothetical protein
MPSADVQTYTGYWINWSHGAVHGATITLPQQYGGLLAAFLALYVAFAGGMFWRILAFALHQSNTTKPDDARDGLHYQRQVILRNVGGGASTAWAFLILPWSWRQDLGRSLLRCLPFAFLASATAILFGVAGVFTSAVTKVPGNSTLVTGPTCGGWAANEVTVNGGSFLSKALADTYEAAAYVRQCYQSGGNATGQACGAYVRPRIPYTTNQNASCPFGPGACMITDTAAFEMDTGLLDSHFDFGINAQPRDRIKYRRVATCAPLHTKPIGSVRNTTLLGPVVYLDAGPQPNLGLNYTFSYQKKDETSDFGYYLAYVIKSIDYVIPNRLQFCDASR